MAAQEASKDVRVTLLGMPLHRLFPSHHVQLLVLGATVLSASVSCAALQERVLYIPGFKYTGWLAIATSLTYVVLALIERIWEDDRRRVGSLLDYIKLSLMTMGGMYLTNFSLHYLSYPLRVVFKSSKLIPVMVISVCYLKKSYTLTQYISVCLLTTGVVVFTLGDAKGQASFNPKGMVIIAIGSFLEAMAANFEEKRLFHQLGSTASEVVLYSSLIGCMWATCADLLAGELQPALYHSADHPETVPIMVLSGVAGYIATSGVLVIIKHFGATAAEIVKSCRKITTICISFFIYGKPWNFYHVAGGVLFVSSVAVERSSKGTSSRRFAIALLGSAAFFSFQLVVAGTGPSAYSVVIDAGSAGTRLNVFRFDAWTLKLLDIRGSAQVFLEREPGISALAGNFSALKAQLDPLLQAAMDAVPMGQRSSTPFALRATAPLEQLQQADSEKLMGQIRQLVSPIGFQDRGIRAMTGDEEGVAEWLTLNFLMGSFRPGIQRVGSPVNVIDLGGATVQMAYFISDADAGKAKRQDHTAYVKRITLPFGSGNADIYQHSYPGYGMISAKAKSMRELKEAGFDGEHPCWPRAAELRLEKLSAVGAADADACRSLIDHMLHEERSCEPGEAASVQHAPKGNCSFAGAWRGPGSRSQRIAVASYFYDRMRDAGVITSGVPSGQLRVSDFMEQAGRACRSATLGLEALVAEYPALSRERAAWMCFDITFQARLLLRGFDFREDQQLLVVKKVAYNGLQFEASWALGVAISQLIK